MRYPQWFPYPKPWLKGFILLVMMFPCLFLVGVLMQITFNLLGFGWTSPEFDIQTLLNGLLLEWRQGQPWKVAIFVVINLVIFPVFLLGAKHQILWGKDLKRFTWIPHIHSWGEGFWSWLIAIFALSVVGFFIVININSICPDYKYLRHCRTDEKEARQFFITYGMVFVIVSAYLYHLQFLLRRWWLTNSPKWFPKKKDNQSGENDVR